MLYEVQKVNKTYQTGKVAFQALHDIDINIEKGEFVALAGPSGSGKTTLLNLIGCLDKPDNGKLILDSQDLIGKKSDDLAYLRREYFGFIFQTYNLIPVLTVFENVEIPLKLLKKYTDDEIKTKVDAILKRVGLEGLGERHPQELSGGQQQRVSIARALVKSPKMVLADEPTANLDSKTGEAIVDLMKEMNEEDGVTFVFSTHDPLIMKHAKRMIKLHDGRVVQ